MQKLGFFRALTPLFVGSNPATPAKNAVFRLFLANFERLTVVFLCLTGTCAGTIQGG